MATWTAIDGCLADGLPMRVYLAEQAGRILGASSCDDVHPRSADDFVWSLGPELTWKRSEEALAEAVAQVKEYFAGERRAFILPFSLRGTAFQKQVWSSLLEIPYGETLSYGEIAEQVGRPAACRAVGNANGKNNVGLLIPCHRVIAAGGKIGGYRGGLGLKRRLLAHEQFHLQGPAKLHPELSSFAKA